MYKLQQASIDAVNVMSSSGKLSESTIGYAKKTATAIEGVNSEIDSITQMTELIATAVEEQSSVVQGVDVNIVQIRDIGEQVAIDSQNNANESKNVAKLAKDLFEEANVFKV